MIQGAIGSALAAGSVVGSLMAGPISDKWGRRDRYDILPLVTGAVILTPGASIFMACIWWLVGTAIQVGTNGFGSLIGTLPPSIPFQPLRFAVDNCFLTLENIAGRILNGVCVGITSSQVPVYLAEVARVVWTPLSEIPTAFSLINIALSGATRENHPYPAVGHRVG